MILIQIFTEIILPVFLLISVGVAADRFLPVDLGTISKLSFYVFISAVVFVKLIDSQLDPAHFGIVTAFSLVHLLVSLVVAWQFFRLRPFRENREVLTMGTVFFNCGNFGIPFAQLAFGDLGVSVMTILLTTQLIANFTIGLWLVGVGQGNWRLLALAFLKSPVIYAILAALLVSGLHITLPKPVYQSAQYLAGGMVPMALLTLGVQLSRSRGLGQIRPLATISLVRLVLSPLLAAGMVAAASAWLGPAISGPLQELGPILIASLGLPVAVNVYILSVEYHRDPELASQSIVWTTLLSALTLSVWLLIVR